MVLIGEEIDVMSTNLTVKRVVSFAMALLLIIGSIINVSAIVNAESAEKTVITISVPTCDAAFNKMLNHYEELNPEIDIQVINQDYDTETGKAGEEIGQKVHDELISENGADIYFTEMVNRYKLADEDLFVDLYSLMDNDPDFNKDDYYMNVIDGLSYKDKLYWMPMTFGNYMFSLNTNLIGMEECQKYESLNFSQMEELVDTYGPSVVFDKNNGLLSLIEFAEEGKYIDFESFTVNINSDDYAEVLERIESLPIGELSDSYGYKAPTGKGVIANTFGSNLTEWQKYELDSSDKYVIPYADDEGNAFYYAVGHVLSINKNSKNVDMAWDLVKFMISEMDISDDSTAENYYLTFPYSGFYPVNKANFNKFASIMLTDEATVKMIDEINSKLSKRMPMEYFITTKMTSIESEYGKGEIDRSQYLEQKQEKLEEIINEY